MCGVDCQFLPVPFNYYSQLRHLNDYENHSSFMIASMGLSESKIVLERFSAACFEADNHRRCDIRDLLSDEEVSWPFSIQIIILIYRSSWGFWTTCGIKFPLNQRNELKRPIAVNLQNMRRLPNFTTCLRAWWNLSRNGNTIFIAFSLRRTPSIST